MAGSHRQKGFMPKTKKVEIHRSRKTVTLEFFTYVKSELSKVRVKNWYHLAEKFGCSRHTVRRIDEATTYQSFLDNVKKRTDKSNVKPKVAKPAAQPVSQPGLFDQDAVKLIEVLERIAIAQERTAKGVEYIGERLAASNKMKGLELHNSKLEEEQKNVKEDTITQPTDTPAEDPVLAKKVRGKARKSVANGESTVARVV